MDENILSKENMKKVMADYEDVICDSCRKNLPKLCEPLAKKLNAGKIPGVADTMRLLNGLCSKCLYAMRRRKKELEEERS